MKSALLLLLVFLGSAASATLTCPNLAGKYECTDDTTDTKNKTDLEITQVTNDGETLYTVNQNGVVDSILADELSKIIHEEIDGDFEVTTKRLAHCSFGNLYWEDKMRMYNTKSKREEAFGWDFYSVSSNETGELNWWHLSRNFILDDELPQKEVNYTCKPI